MGFEKKRAKILEKFEEAGQSSLVNDRSVGTATNYGGAGVFQPHSDRATPSSGVGGLPRKKRQLKDTGAGLRVHPY
jgi:hypothetical protein